MNQERINVASVESSAENIDHDPGKRRPIVEPINDNRFGDDAFVSAGCKNWKKALAIFREHEGSVNSTHDQARILFEGFKNQRQSVEYNLTKFDKEDEVNYRIRLTASLNVTRILLKQGLAFQGNDESLESENRGNFLEILEWLREQKLEVAAVTLENAPSNNQMVSPLVQKELTNCCAVETTKVILEDIKNRNFSLLVDEARDASIKEQMALVLRYVNNDGEIVERFLALVHVTDTTAKSLKEGIDLVFAKHGLSLSRLRGQGYDGASNMRGEYNGLKSLILNENPSVNKWSSIIEVLENVFEDGSNPDNRGISKTLSMRMVLDLLTQEMENHFPKINTELLTCINSLSPKNSFASFNVDKLVHLAELYPADFSSIECISLPYQLKTFINDIVDKVEFSNIEDLGNLAKILVSTSRDKAFPLVYRLIELTLILPVATASVEKVFSSMKLIKTDLRNRMGDEWMNDIMVVYIERGIFKKIENETILRRFQDMKTRRKQLSSSVS
ncbi:uncharacterized protein LOC121745754 [Salvia splendens]|uniref:uncharacterized protein LOC121745754 n=1 Tax=Salvia splendens TaxID=180675 RepID=UPI001C260400|nr:uncharacterized protein LOC121745754 [Salvia splendens]